MAQQHQAVVGPEAGWVVGELEGGDGPRVEAGASQQILADEGAMMAGPGADEEEARPAGQPRDDRRRKRVPKQTRDRVGLCLDGLFEKRAGSLQAASSQALRNW
jgi:hypothetical protein